jgi:hypothetical protein
MDPVERDRRAYELAVEFMDSLCVAGVTKEVIDRYLHPDTRTQLPSDIPGLYFRLLKHATYAGMKFGVIHKALGGIERLSSVLCNFEPRGVLATFKTPDEILDRIEGELKPRGKIRRTSRSIWPSYCKTILSAASFIVEFDSVDDFNNWARFFHDDPRAMPALPLLIECQVFGIGFALACDFLKGLGYHNFSKPDIHIKDIFERLELATSRDDFEVFQAVARVAKSAGQTPYCIDKIFWLIGSGNFHDDPEIGRIGNNKERFYEFALPRLRATPLEPKALKPFESIRSS